MMYVLYIYIYDFEFGVICLLMYAVYCIYLYYINKKHTTQLRTLRKTPFLRRRKPLPFSAILRNGHKPL